MNKEIRIDYTTPEGIREGLIKIRIQKHHLDALKAEIEGYQERLEKLEKDCITALIMGKDYPHQASVLYIPDRLFGKD